MPPRRLDIQAQIDGKLIDIDVKVFQSNTWKGNLDDMMNFNAVVKDNAFQAGQLFNDVVAFAKDGTLKRFVFLPSVQATADDILEHIGDLMISSKHAPGLRQALNVTEDAWPARVEEILTAMSREKFIEVNSLENLLN